MEDKRNQHIIFTLSLISRFLTLRPSSSVCCGDWMQPPWQCMVAAVTAALVLLTGPHAVTGHQPVSSVTGETGSAAPVPPPPPSWSECTDLALASLHPPVRHSLGDAWAWRRKGLANTGAGFRFGLQKTANKTVVWVCRALSHFALRAILTHPVHTNDRARRP